MRTKKVDTSIKISKETHKRLIADRDEFQKVIGGGKWSVDDTIMELYKIINGKLAINDYYYKLTDNIVKTLESVKMNKEGELKIKDLLKKIKGDDEQ